MHALKTPSQTQERFIEWSDDYSVGIEEIDEQHKVLVGLLNQMHEAIHQRKGAAVTDGILARLGEYTRVHFAVEESLMRLFEYPDYEQHKQQHEQLVADLEELVTKLKEGKKSISIELVHFLKLWVINHIHDSDKEYTKHFLTHGIKAKSSNKSWLTRLFH